MKMRLRPLDMRILWELGQSGSLGFNDLLSLLALERDLMIALSNRPQWHKALLLLRPRRRMALEASLARLQDLQLVQEVLPPVRDFQGLLQRILPHSRASLGRRTFRITAYGGVYIEYLADL